RGYGSSRFKGGEAARFIVLAVPYRLVPDGASTVRYADLEKDLAARGISRPSLRDVRTSVLAIRRSKSMVLDPADDNRRSCGSFFLNPIVDATRLAEVERAAGDASVPRWPEAGGRTEGSAARASQAPGLPHAS